MGLTPLQLKRWEDIACNRHSSMHHMPDTLHVQQLRRGCHATVARPAACGPVLAAATDTQDDALQDRDEDAEWLKGCDSQFRTLRIALVQRHWPELDTAFRTPAKKPPK